MSNVKRWAIGIAIGFFFGILLVDRSVVAQSPPIQIQSSISHTACTVTASTTTYCFANDGLYVSLNGAAFTQIGGSTGVTSITVNGGVPQTGPIALTIPSKATTTVTASTTLQ